MAEFGAAGAGLRDEDRRALKEGKKLLKKALGAAGVLKGGKHKEKLRREKQRRREGGASEGCGRGPGGGGAAGRAPPARHGRGCRAAPPSRI